MEYTTTDIDRAADQFRAGEQALLRPDGTRKYGDEEHTERVQALLAAFDRTGEAAVQHADTVIAESERTVHALAHDDPVNRLSADDLAKANAKALFIREDAESLDLAELTERLRVALASGDKPTQYLYARYGDRRAKSVSASMRQGAAGVDAEALRELNAVLAEFNALLADPHAASKRAKEEATIKEARALRMHAGTIHAELSGARERTLAAMRQRYGM